MSLKPGGFMSYVRFDDEHEHGRLSEFCKRLAGEVKMQTGDEFPIFQDRKDIGWGEQWLQRINESLDAVTFLIPIITPGFFKSKPCRAELKRFLDREDQLGRGDLILPVYYVNCPILHDDARRKADPLAEAIAARQHVDWRELRFEPLTSPQVWKTPAKMATQIVEALERGQPEGAPVPTPTLDDARRGSNAARSEPTDYPETPRGPAQMTEPPTLVVDAFHRGDYPTLTEALAAAEPGTRILVRPGFYQEGVVIDKPVEIIGDGDLDDIVIEANGKHAVSFQANMGRIANLTLRQMGGGKWFCVDIAQGRLDLEGCDISSQSLSCVAIRDGADPRLKSNAVHDGKQSGVYVYGNGLGTLEDNDIFSNRLTGVQVRKGGNPTLRRNRISKNSYRAILVHDGSGGVFEDNDLRGNDGGAWLVSTDSEAKVKRARNQE